MNLKMIRKYDHKNNSFPDSRKNYILFQPLWIKNDFVLYETYFWVYKVSIIEQAYWHLNDLLKSVGGFNNFRRSKSTLVRF